MSRRVYGIGVLAETDRGSGICEEVCVSIEALAQLEGIRLTWSYTLRSAGALRLRASVSGVVEDGPRETRLGKASHCAWRIATLSCLHRIS